MSPSVPPVEAVGGKFVSAKPTVLLLCVHNAGRSQMAAAWMKVLAGDRVAPRG